MLQINDSTTYIIDDTMPNADDRAFFNSVYYHLIDSEYGFVGEDFDDLGFVQHVMTYVIDATISAERSHVFKHSACIVVGTLEDRPSIHKHQAVLIQNPPRRHELIGSSCAYIIEQG